MLLCLFIVIMFNSIMHTFERREKDRLKALIAEHMQDKDHGARQIAQLKAQVKHERRKRGKTPSTHKNPLKSSSDLTAGQYGGGGYPAVAAVSAASSADLSAHRT